MKSDIEVEERLCKYIIERDLLYKEINQASEENDVVEENSLMQDLKDKCSRIWELRWMLDLKPPFSDPNT